MPQRRQNSMVRGPTMSIFGCSMLPSVFSISVQGTPRQPSSPASASPTGPAPTMSTGVCAVLAVSMAGRSRLSALVGIFELERIELVLVHEPLPLGEVRHQRRRVAHKSFAPKLAQGRLHALDRRLQRDIGVDHAGIAQFLELL